MLTIQYHAIESITPFGLMLSLLYVSSHEDQWEIEKEQNDIILSYTINFTYPKHSEFGDIVVWKQGVDGALIRLF